MKTSPRILLVDDRPEDLRLLIHILRPSNYDVLIALDGWQGIKRATSNPPDLIVMDISMPGLDGFHTIQSLRSNPLTTAIPVIFLSVKDDLNDRLTAFELGAVDYVTKPYDAEEMAARIEARLDAHHSLSIENNETTSQTHDGVIAQAAQQYILAHLSDRKLPQAVRSLLGIGEKKLNAIFLHVHGKSLPAFVNEARLQKAMKLLTESEISIGEIADQTGHSSPANFTTAFGQRTGVTPAVYRRLKRQSGNTEIQIAKEENQNSPRPRPHNMEQSS